jgi:exodeoxyribonuclease V alpha subunit
VVRLDTIFRQELASRIIVNCHRINEGRMPEAYPDGSGDYLFIPEEDPERILAETIRQVTLGLPGRYGLDPMRDIQVLSPMHKGVLGVESLNRHLQQALNPSGRPFRRGSVEFRVGDKVMQTRNNYELEVFNGDIGTLLAVDERDGTFRVLRRAGSCSTMQGMRTISRSPTPPPSTRPRGANTRGAPAHPHAALGLLARNLLYTAVSRGRRLVVTIGSARAVKASVENSRSRRRFTRFARRLAGNG